MALKEPVRVSPLIKGARWTFLLVGIAYGSARYSALNKKERIKNEEWERTRPEREAKEQAEKLRKIKEEEKTLAAEVGVTIE